MGLQDLANQPDLKVVDDEQKRSVVIDVAIPADSTIRTKGYEEIEKHQGLKELLEPLVKGVLGAVSPKLEK